MFRVTWALFLGAIAGAAAYNITEYVAMAPAGGGGGPDDDDMFTQYPGAVSPSCSHGQLSS